MVHWSNETGGVVEMLVERGRVVEVLQRGARGVDHAFVWWLTAADRHEHWCRPALSTGRPVVDAALRARTWFFAPPRRFDQRRPASTTRRPVHRRLRVPV